MSRRIVVVGAVLFVLVVVGLALPFIVKARAKSHFVGSQNNLREVALFAGHHAKPDPKNAARKLPAEIPAGTVALLGTPPDDRLSWVVAVLPGLDQRRVPSEQLLGAIDRTKPWNDDTNQRAARTRVTVLLCPESTPDTPPGAPAVTCYVGIGGLGANAATLPVESPRAGAMRYDTPTPFDRITDGLSQTLLFGESRNEVGPWLRGGFATVRGLDDAPGVLPLIGTGGQFGGYFPDAANFALCDGSVRPFSPRVEPRVLYGLATIAGKDTDPVPGD